jgi:N-acetylmuramoyl-L-alanine amidase
LRRAAVALACVLSIVGSDLGMTRAIASTQAVIRTIAGPAIVWRPIPFGARRKRQMAAYSERHYGRRTYELSAPKVIVEHYTDGVSFESAWNLFASNTRHLGEKPGTCAHFIIDTDGTVYQLVRLRIRCRHVIGLNHNSIGIEHVGTNERQILRNHAMMHSSLRLTLWLMQRFGINVGNVIGHAESLRSPNHRELYPSWRCMTHSDWLHRYMKVYRRRLRDLAQAKGVPGGAGPVWGNDCS